MTGYHGPEGITLRAREAFRDLPTVPIPCSRCVDCRKAATRSWALRCLHEASLHPASCFFTLTYAPEHLPQDRSLSKADCSAFLKRLRRHLDYHLDPAPRIRFYLTGEYGPKTLRPHYHGLLFGWRPDDGLIVKAQGPNDDHPLLTSPTLTRVWGMGYTTFGPLTSATAGYAAGYAMKKLGSPRRRKADGPDPAYERVSGETGEVWYVEPEFHLMSRRPGLGHDWLMRWWDDAYPGGFVVEDGYKQRTPRYYDSLCERHRPELYKAVREKRRSFAARAPKVDLAARERILEHRERSRVRSDV